MFMANKLFNFACFCLRGSFLQCSFCSAPPSWTTQRRMKTRVVADLERGRLRIRKGTNIPSLSSSLLAQFNASNRKKPIHWFGYPLRHFQDALARSSEFPLCNSNSSYTTWLVAGWGWNSLVAVTDKVNPFRTSGSNGKIESYWKSQYWRQTTEE